MAKARVDLERMLVKLDQHTSEMLRDSPDNPFFIATFAAEADAIIAEAGMEDQAWVHGRINAILLIHGKQERAIRPID